MNPFKWLLRVTLTALIFRVVGWVFTRILLPLGALAWLWYKTQSG